MPHGNTVDMYYKGDQQMDALYAGAVKIWPPVVAVPGIINLTYDGALNAGNSVAFSITGAYQVDWGDGSAVELFTAGATATHTYATTGVFPAVATSQPGEAMTTYLNNPSQDLAVQQPTEIVFDAPGLTELNSNFGGEPTSPPQITDARRHLTRVEFVQPAALTTCLSMFDNESLLVEVVGDLGTSAVTDFKNMFLGCSALTAVPDLDTSAGKIFAFMFQNCSALTSVPVLNTSLGTDFSSMLFGCTGLTVIPALDTSSGTDFDGFVQSCSGLTTIPMMDTSKGTKFFNMFMGCTALTSIPALVTSAGTNFSYMFTNCTVLPSIPLLDTSSGTNFYSMFANCKALTTIPALVTSAGTDFSSMFIGCTALTIIPPLDTSSGTKFPKMFEGCAAITTIPTLNTALGTKFARMFYGCSVLTAIPPLDMSLGTDFQTIFFDCDALAEILAFGICYSVAIDQSTNLDAADVNLFLTNLGTAAGAQTVTVGSVGPGYDPTIATAKGWTVA